MNRGYFKMICLVFTAGLFLFTDITIGSASETARLEEVKSLKHVEGRIDSVRPDKIVVTYEPEGQEGSLMQIYFLRDQQTRFLNRREEATKTGDIVGVAYEESRWINEDGRLQVQRIARGIRYVRSRESEERKQEQQKPLGIKGRLRGAEQGETGPQEAGPQ